MKFCQNSLISVHQKSASHLCCRSGKVADESSSEPAEKDESNELLYGCFASTDSNIKLNHWKASNAQKFPTFYRRGPDKCKHLKYGVKCFALEINFGK